jgi:hypothetical protein
MKLFHVKPEPMPKGAIVIKIKGLEDFIKAQAGK